MNAGIAKKIAQLRSDPRKVDEIRGIAYSIAEIERAQSEALCDLQEAVGVDDPIEPVDRDERMDEILEFVAALADSSDDRWWLEHFVGVEDPDEAEKYLGLQWATWKETAAEIAEDYRQDLDEDHTDTQIVRAHVRSHFDIDLEEFEDLVVNGDRQKRIGLVMGRNMELIEQEMQRTTDLVDDAGEE